VSRVRRVLPDRRRAGAAWRSPGGWRSDPCPAIGFGHARPFLHRAGPGRGSGPAAGL